MTVDGKVFAQPIRFPLEFFDTPHKITAFVTNTLGFVSFATLETSGETSYASPFADTADNWAEEIITYMYNQRLVSGAVDAEDGELKFFPQKEMTRAEFAMMVANFMGTDVTAYGDIELPYTDIDEIPEWVISQVKVLYNLGIIQGRLVEEDGTRYFDPLASITRAEAAAIIGRILPKGLPQMLIKSEDAEDIPAWAVSSMQTLQVIGAMRGYEDGTVMPNKNLTKAEAAKILYWVY